MGGDAHAEPWRDWELLRVTERTFGADERPRHWLVDALLGGGLALGLITAAEAALPHRVPRPLPLAAAAQPKPRPQLVLAAAAVTPRPAPSPVLIAFHEPLPGYSVGSPFGLRQLPWEAQPRLHAGVDIEAPAGTPILAAADGVVTRTGVDPGYGRFVELKHAAGLSTLYAHMGPFLPGVALGTAVKAGVAVGQTGSTGTSTGAHLHFEIRDAQNRPLNPELFLGRSFAAQADLPLRQALRAPRVVRVAFVSTIPASKRAAMDARLADEAAAGAGEAPVAVSAGSAAMDASATVAPGGRLRVRYRVAK